MTRLAIVATFKVAPEKRNDCLAHMKAHAERCRATEPGAARPVTIPPSPAGRSPVDFSPFRVPVPRSGDRNTSKTG